MSEDRIVYWRGERVEDMSREELIGALNELGCMYREATSPHLARAQALGRVEMLKRGEA